MANQMDKLEKRTDSTLDLLNRASLIATYYVLKRDPTNQLNIIKEETTMKKRNRLGSKMSNRTKTMGSLTIAFALGTIVSAIHDNKNAESIEVTDNVAFDEIGELADTVGDVVEEIADEI